METVFRNSPFRFHSSWRVPSQPAAAVQSKPLGTLVAGFGGGVSKLGPVSVAALSGWEPAVTAIEVHRGPPAG